MKTGIDFPRCITATKRLMIFVTWMTALEFCVLHQLSFTAMFRGVKENEIVPQWAV